ncbi:hypothetical protein D3C72_1298740 [compost metagenome]
MLMTAISFNLLNDFFDVLDGVSVGNQHRVFGLYNHQIFDANRGDQAGFRIDIAVFGFVADDIAMMDVAFRRMGADFPQRGPGADIAPARIHRHHHRVRRAFHYRVIH